MSDRYKERDAMSSTCRVARARLLEPHILNDQVWEEVFGEGGFDLRDNRARIFALDRFGKVHIYKRIRVGEVWLAPLIGEVSSFKEMTQLSRKMKVKSPWRSTYIQKVVVTTAQWDEDYHQWVIRFPFKKEPKLPAAKRMYETAILKGQVIPKVFPKETTLPTTSYFFEDEFVKASDLDGWITPRKQNQGRPWGNGMNVIEERKPPKVWVPDLTDEEFRLLATNHEENKCAVIRALNKRHNAEVVAGIMSPMDIKGAVEKLLEVLKK